jgi:antibiotic biosynthesis monooxygenase (ABM) superfamily enzyme
MALMIWLAVFPTLTILYLILGDWLRTLNPILRTFVLATIAVPIISYALMPQLHRLRRNLLSRTVGFAEFATCRRSRDPVKPSTENR